MLSLCWREEVILFLVAGAGRRLAKQNDQMDISLNWVNTVWSLRGNISILVLNLDKKVKLRLKFIYFYSLFYNLNHFLKIFHGSYSHIKLPCHSFVYKKTLKMCSWSFCLLKLCQQKQSFCFCFAIQPISIRLFCW